MVAQQLLSPTTDRSDVSLIVEDLLDGIAVAEEVEEGSPEVLATFFDAPLGSGGLADEAVPGLFVGFARPRAEENRAKAGDRKSVV